MTDLPSDHVHVEGNDPRHTGICVKCGRLMPPRTYDLSGETDTYGFDPFLHKRDPEWEQLTTYREAAGENIVGFIQSAELRAKAGAETYGFEFPSEARDLELDAYEEVVDLRNYIVWELDRYRRGINVRNEQKELRLRRRLRLACQIAADMLEDRPDLSTATQPGGHRATL